MWQPVLAIQTPSLGLAARSWMVSCAELGLCIHGAPKASSTSPTVPRMSQNTLFVNIDLYNLQSGSLRPHVCQLDTQWPPAIGGQTPKVSPPSYVPPRVGQFLSRNFILVSRSAAPIFQYAAFDAFM